MSNLSPEPGPPIRGIAFVVFGACVAGAVLVYAVLAGALDLAGGGAPAVRIDPAPLVAGDLDQTGVLSAQASDR